MQIRMTETLRGSSDGFAVHQFHKDCIYTVGENIGDSLARRFISEGRAIDLDTRTKDEVFADFLKELSERRAS